MSGVQQLLRYNLPLDAEKFIAEVESCPNDPELVRELWGLIHPFLYWRDAAITNRTEEILELDGGALTIPSVYVSRGLAECRWATVMALSIGPELPAEAIKCAKEGALYRSSVADLLGSHGVEQLAESFCAYLQQKVLSAGRFATLRYSPGYGDWPLSEQPNVLDFLNKCQGKIQLSEHNLMEPVKTITAIIGWAPTWQKKEYPTGNRNSFCNGGHNCAACTTWACRKGNKSY